ncbi:MAG: aminoacyl-tRNA hydrolase [Burkholderiaceae bacterium]
MSAIRLIVGLGNVGREYERTRHNAGFWVVDRLAEEAGTSFTNETKFFGALARATIAGRAVWLLKPGTYMNLSGRAVAAVANFYRIPVGEILVAHDDLDLPSGTAKIKRGGGNAGQRGLKDIQAQLGSPDFWRLRIGIDHPRELGLVQQVVDYVLHSPSREQQERIEDAIGRALPAARDLVGGDFEGAMMRLHTRP